MLPTELIIGILAECDYETVLEAGRVCKRWRDVVTSRRENLSRCLLKREFRVDGGYKELQIRRAFRRGEFGDIKVLEDHTEEKGSVGKQEDVTIKFSWSGPLEYAYTSFTYHNRVFWIDTTHDKVYSGLLTLTPSNTFAVTEKQVVYESGTPITTLFTRDDGRFIIAIQDSFLVYSSVTMQKVSELAIPHVAAFNYHGDRFVCAYDDMISVFDLISGKVVCTWQTGRVMTEDREIVNVFICDQKVAIAYPSGEIFIYDLFEYGGSVVSRMDGYVNIGRLTSEFSKKEVAYLNMPMTLYMDDQLVIASGCCAQTLFVYDRVEKKMVGEITCELRLCFADLRDGIVFSSSVEGGLVICDVLQGRRRDVRFAKMNESGNVWIAYE